MKKLNLLSLSLALFVSNFITAQNPFASIGKTTKPMLSLSDGKYVEHFENDSVRQIGSAMVNVYTEQIVAFVDRKSEAKKIHSQTSSRFLSIDPLARRFPFYTPYQFAGNTPIAAIDLDGLESFVANKNPESNSIVLTLVNAEDALSVIWSDKDKETKTDPLQISEVQKFVYNVSVDKKTGTITIPENGSDNPQTFNYTKYEKNIDGTFKKDVNGQLRPLRGQGILGKGEIAEHIRGNFGLEIPGGLIMSGKSSDKDVLDGIWAGATLKNDEYDQIDVFIKPELQGQFLDIAKSMELDLTKINFTSKPQKGADNNFEMIYKKTDKTVEEIK